MLAVYTFHISARHSSFAFNKVVVVAFIIRLTKTIGLLMISGFYFAVSFWHLKHRINSILLLYKGMGKVVGHTGSLKVYADHGG